MIMACIYCITNKINGKQYVGKSITDAECRFKEHISDSKKIDVNTDLFTEHLINTELKILN